MRSIVFILSVATSAVLSAATDPELTPAEKAYFQRGYMAVRSSYIELDGKFYCCPAYDPAYDNSNHAQSAQWIREHTEKLEFDSPLLDWVKTESLVPPRAEAEAYCHMLPEVQVGQYGFIRESSILRNANDGSIEITKITLVDSAGLEKQKELDKKALDQWAEELRAEARQRNWQARRDRNWKARPALGPGAWGEWIDKAEQINENRYAQREALIKVEQTLARYSIEIVGVNDTRLQPGKPYTNQQLIVIDRADNRSTESSGTLTMAPATLFRRGLNPQQFETLLKSREISNKTFAGLIESKLKENPQSFRDAVIELLGDDAQPAPPAQLTKSEQRAARDEEREDHREAKEAARELSPFPRRRR